MSEAHKDAERAAFDELSNIANAKRFDRETFADDTEFADWAQNRARHTLARAASPQAPAVDGAEAVAVIGSGFQLLYCRENWSEGLKVGDHLYTRPPLHETTAAEPIGWPFLAELHADAAYLFHRVQQGSLAPDEAAKVVRDKIDAARASSPVVNERADWSDKSLALHADFEKYREPFRKLWESQCPTTDIKSLCFFFYRSGAASPAAESTSQVALGVLKATHGGFSFVPDPNAPVIPYEGMSVYAAPPPREAATVPQLKPRLLTQLRRFNECCEDPDAGGHDVDKEDMHSLAEMGAVRPAPGGRHYLTDFGQYLLATSPAAESNTLPRESEAHEDAEREADCDRYHVLNEAAEALLADEHYEAYEVVYRMMKEARAASPQAPAVDGAEAVAVPEGWKLVPVEPDQAMIDAAQAVWHAPHQCADPTMHVWDAMLATSPAAESNTLPRESEGES